MNLIRASIPDLLICEPTKLKDERGFFLESFRKNTLEEFLGYSLNFCQDNLSESKFGVLRGLHFQLEPYAQSKLVSVVKGKILDVAVDIRKNSKFYGQSFSIELDDKSNKQLFIPKGFAHGFVVLSKTARVNYKVTNYYNPKYERGLNYNDSLLGIDWKIDEKLIFTNKKDTNYSPFGSEIFFNK